MARLPLIVQSVRCKRIGLALKIWLQMCTVEGSVAEGRVLQDAISRRHGLKVPHGSVAEGRVLQDAISRRHGLKVPHGCYYLVDAGYTNCEGFFTPFRGQIYHLNEWRQGYQPIMSGFSQSSVSSQNSRGTKRKWVPEEDVALVACMVDLHNVGTFNADTGFRAGYLNELEKILEKVLPNAMLKAKPNLESRIRTLKRDWSIVYDMLSGKSNSGFGWDEHRQLVVAEDAVWNSYINSHKEADQATGKDAQTTTDIIEEIDVEDVATTNIHEERNDFYRCEADVSLDDMDVLATQLQPARNQGDSTFLKKNKKDF
ncbi:hypothetical protein GOBAR_DD25283 [Gossypium barbadense]|nr:hypothetical protein GOBAR_DD25283 [Gossypium barbadense]